MKLSDENLNISDSQSLSSSDMLSLPSEPPDVKNWFSSYVYESPNIDTSATLVEYLHVDHSCGKEGDGFAMDEEREENLFECRETREQNELDVSEKRYQRVCEEKKHGDSSDVLDSFSSPAVLSAPPNIRNWFSSYVYESPGISASSFYEGSAFVENECKEYSPVEDSKTKEEEGLDDFGCMRTRGELFDGEKTFSHESQNHEKHYEQAMQPPIEASKSLSSATKFPAISGNRYLEESATEENVCKIVFPVEESSNRKGKGQFKTGIIRSSDESFNDGKIISNVVGEPDTMLGDIELKMQSTKKFNKKNKGATCSSRESITCYKKPSDKSSGDDVLQNHGIDPKDVGELNLDVEDFLFRAGGYSSNETNFTVEEINASSSNCYKNRINLVGAEINQKFDRAPSESKLETGRPLRKSSCVSLEDPPDEGFVRTKSRRIFNASDENCKKRQERSFNRLKENPIVSSIKGEKDVRKRMVLAEKTNITCSNDMEFPGKWRCPQKSKPKLGPPLKQLRLEKWLNRM